MFDIVHCLAKYNIKKPNGGYRALKIPTIRDRVVQDGLKLILEPIFDADFQPGSFGYRPKRTAHQAIRRVSEGLVKGKTRVIDVDLKAYFDTIRRDTPNLDEAFLSVITDHTAGDPMDEKIKWVKLTRKKIQRN